MALNNGQKAKIHVAKKQVGMNEDEYRALLSGVGMKSAADPGFTGTKYRAVMDRFKELGFVPKKKKRYQPASGKEALTSKITAIRNDLGLTESYVDAMAQHMFKISSYRWLDAKQLHKLVAALSYHQIRKQGGKRARKSK